MENKIEPRESLCSFLDKSPKHHADFDKILRRDVVISPTEEQFELLLKKIKQQLGEGRGEIIVEVNFTRTEENNIYCI